MLSYEYTYFNNKTMNYACKYYNESFNCILEIIERKLDFHDVIYVWHLNQNISFQSDISKLIFQNSKLFPFKLINKYFVVEMISLLKIYR